MAVWVRADIDTGWNGRGEGEATAQLAQILDAVERGETIAITRHGRRIARLVPKPDKRRERVGRAIEELRALGRENGPITAEEIISARHEGHRGFGGT